VPENFENRRVEASLASGGISDDAIYRMALTRLQEHGARQSILDFGAGVGHFTQRLSQSNLYASITGADLMARPSGLPDAVSWVQADLNGSLPIEDAAFDAIAAIEVIEHLENPRAMLRECSRLLRPGGLLVLTTPNNESFRSLLSFAARGYFAAFGPQSYPAHITPILLIDLQRMVAEIGLHDGDVRYSDQGAIPRLTSIQWQTLPFSNLKGRRFSDNLLFACRKPS
jgi:SAM-dependent methyltransferase